MDHGPASSPARSVSSPPLDLTGRTLGDFHVLRRLGQGGMGTVFLAEQISLKRKVALKLLRPELAADPAALKRFRAEAEAIARINHPNIVQVYAVGDADGLPFMAMEYVNGKTLREIVVRKGPPDLPIALAILRQAAAALQRAAEANLVHRDIKPENILVTRNVEVKVADFGLSRLLDGTRELNLTQTGITLGTPLYMSPEQVRNRPLDPRSDIYSLGVTCYYMLSGQPPFHGGTAMEVALKHCEETPKSLAELCPELPGEIVALVHRMMEKDPARRPQSGRDILRELSRMERGEPVGELSLTWGAGGPNSSGPTTLPATERLPAPHRAARRWALPIVALLAAAALGAGAKIARNYLAAPDVAINDRPNLEVVSNSERLLRLAVEEHANPKPDKLREGLTFHVRLGVLYWDQRRLDEALRFFNELQKRPNQPQQYAMLGHLGTAITLALLDDSESAVRAARMLADWPARFPQYRGLLTTPILPPEDVANLKFWLTTALDRLAVTSAPLPKSLDRLRDEAKNRRPPPPQPPGGKGPSL